MAPLPDDTPSLPAKETDVVEAGAMQPVPHEVGEGQRLGGKDIAHARLQGRTGPDDDLTVPRARK